MRRGGVVGVCRSGFRTASPLHSSVDCALHSEPSRRSLSIVLFFVDGKPCAMQAVEMIVIGLLCGLIRRASIEPDRMAEPTDMLPADDQCSDVQNRANGRLKYRWPPKPPSHMHRPGSRSDSSPTRHPPPIQLAFGTNDWPPGVGACSYPVPTMEGNSARHHRRGVETSDGEAKRTRSTSGKCLDTGSSGRTCQGSCLKRSASTSSTTGQMSALLLRSGLCIEPAPLKNLFGRRGRSSARLGYNGTRSLAIILFGRSEVSGVSAGTYPTANLRCNICADSETLQICDGTRLNCSFATAKQATRQSRLALGPNRLALIGTQNLEIP